MFALCLFCLFVCACVIACSLVVVIVVIVVIDDGVVVLVAMRVSFVGGFVVVFLGFCVMVVIGVVVIVHTLVRVLLNLRRVWVVAPFTKLSMYSKYWRIACVLALLVLVSLVCV